MRWCGCAPERPSESTPLDRMATLPRLETGIEPLLAGWFNANTPADLASLAADPRPEGVWRSSS